MKFNWFKQYDYITLTLRQSLLEKINEIVDVVPERSIISSLEELLIQEEEDLANSKLPWEKSLDYSRYYFEFKVQCTLVKIISMMDLFFKSEYVFSDNFDLRIFLHKAYQILYIEKEYVKDFWHTGNVASFVRDRLVCSMLRLQFIFISFHELLTSHMAEENLTLIDAEGSSFNIPVTTETLIPFINYIRASLGSMLKILGNYFEKYREELKIFLRFQTIMAEFLTSNKEDLLARAEKVLSEEDLEKIQIKIGQRNQSAMAFSFDEFKNKKSKSMEIEEIEEDPNRVTRNMHTLMFKKVLQDINSKGEISVSTSKPKTSILKSSIYLHSKPDMVETDLLSPVIQSNENSWLELDESDIIKKKLNQSKQNSNSRIKEKITFLENDEVKKKDKANPGFQKYLETLSLGKAPNRKEDFRCDSKSVLNSKYFSNSGMAASFTYLPKAKIESQIKSGDITKNKSQSNQKEKPLKSFYRTTNYEENKINNLLNELENNNNDENESEEYEAPTFNNPYDDLNKMLSNDLMKFIEGNSVPTDDIDFDEKLNSKEKKRELGGRRKVAKNTLIMKEMAEQLAQDIDLDSEKKPLDDDIRPRPSSKEKKKDTLNSFQTMTTDASENKPFRRNDKKKTSKKLGIAEEDLITINEDFKISEKLEYKPFKEGNTDTPFDEDLLNERTSDSSFTNEEEIKSLRQFESALNNKIIHKGLGVLELINGMQVSGPSAKNLELMNSMSIFDNEQKDSIQFRNRSETKEYEKVNDILLEDNFDDKDGMMIRKPYIKKPKLI